ncbi:toll/interleukin-1 receptor domain-containing protein [Mammaliicoccus sp. I-M35]|uniref:toll/interleukin-1 receptor domain-containing protein n=1 Tax=Mammaliicoccus sp. I-M35 TaxID=2898694 RepID=UPI001EFABF21|nr:toll/interleukin-1 receptor domain-containing protein [Mammaliicoccus sp. I-M35]
MTNNQERKTLFISYAHTNDDHKNRVKEMATELINNGVEVILDIWDFEKGSDLNKKMEDSVTKSDVILIIGDKSYVDKANNREAGVGKESIILSNDYVKNLNSGKYRILYAFTEKDDMGNPILPNYMLGNNSFDMTDDVNDYQVAEEIARTIYGVPIEPKPKLQPIPDFLGKSSMSAIKKIKKVNIIDNKLLDEFIEELKKELAELDKDYKKYQDIHIRRDFSSITRLLKYWDEVVRKVDKAKEIAKVSEELLNTLDLYDRNNNDATRIFIRLSFVYTIAYAINIEFIEDLIKYDYTVDDRETDYTIINDFCNPSFIQNEIYERGILDYNTLYFEVEEIILRDNDFKIVGILEADIFLNFITLFNKEKSKSQFNNWKIVDPTIYSKVEKYKNRFKYLKSFKREKTINELLSLLNMDNLEEFIENLETIKNSKFFLVIKKEEIASQK